MRKLLKKFRKRPEEEEPPGVQRVTLSLASKSDSPHATLATHTATGLSTLTPEARKVESTGLFLVAGGLVQDQQAQYPVDIVAVHGLNGDAETTWTHPNGTFWLRDLLPKFLPGCRIYTYGYPSKIFLNDSLAEVKEFSLNLLNGLRNIHEDSGQRPIILVCHSLGGIVSKQALVEAHTNNSVYGNVLGAIVGIIFLGTPHRGSDIATVVGRVINSNTIAALRVMRIVKTDLIETLNFNAAPLQELEALVLKRLENLAVVSFYETKPTPPLTTLIVEKKSSILGIPHEDVIPLYHNHRDLCRFPGETDSYVAVSRAVRRIATKAQAQRQEKGRVSTRSSQIIFDETEKSCIGLFSRFDVADYQRRLPKPVEGTCQWVLNHPVLASWKRKIGHALLWLTGPPGCGKTIMSFFLARHFEPVPNNVCVYFCDDKIEKQKNANSILIGLIFQIVSRHRSLMRHVRKVFELQGQNIIRSFSALWSVFMQIISDRKSGPLYVIIDALDECEKGSRQDLLDSVGDLLKGGHPTEESENPVKFIFTSRPSVVNTSANISRLVEHRMAIDEGQHGYSEDLRVFIEQRVGEISKKRNWPAEVTDFVLQALYLKADQTFLWIHMVLASLENSPLAAKTDLDKILAKIPPTLEITYRDFLASIPVDFQEPATRLLNLILGSSRPLSLNEMKVAFTIRPTHDSLADVGSEQPPDMAHTLQAILGPLVRVTESKVTLVHQSAKDFLLQMDNKGGTASTILNVSSETATMAIASACIYYLLLEDFSDDLFRAPSPTISSNSSITGSSRGSLLGIGFEDEDEYVCGVAGMLQEVEVIDAQVCQRLASDHVFYHYASMHWAEHYILCEGSAPPELRQAAHTLLDKFTANSLNWQRFFWSETETMGDIIPTDPQPLTLAAYLNLHDALCVILAENGPIPQQDKDHALFWASHKGNGGIVTALLEAGANPNYHLPSGQTALIAAAKAGNLACAEALLTSPVTDINLPYRRTCISPLCFAAGAGHLAIVKLLLSRPDIHPDLPSASGATPFIRAATEGHVAIITTLAKHPKVNINHPDKTGRTALSHAADLGLSSSLRTLLSLPGINPNLADATNRTPLSYAAASGHTPIIRTLIRTKGVIKSGLLDRDNRSPISWAASRGQADAVRVCIKYACGGGVDEPDVDGWAPLAWAIQTDSAETVRALVASREVDLERRDLCGRTALWWAVNYGFAGVVRELLEEGADLGVVAEGKTPLEVAKEMGSSGWGVRGVLEEWIRVKEEDR